ncbi:GSCOCG00003663001-RA-CDS [Cotesia congregata]|uniref:Similar to Tret1: Facilitated trehalose transporter Tret1 (Bombyx mori) n=1 Tax=Cotesia congregata TaxID=51543 RepID=A0A8J2MYD6_COTCN|nr:GSCOCG00003663001-RA-CDS [Cotesia congregata]CAG5107507.1 Similar to Tret1: Facilitated trehalose transporter Tret1 (Bombyx mori) [Cotesia congregata]
MTNQSPQLPNHRFGLWPQWLAALELLLMSMMVGLISGWTSPYLAKLDSIENPDSELPINKVEASWIASLINLSRPGGAILGAIFVYVIGSRLTTLLAGIPFALGWASFLIMNSVTLVYVSRTLCGIGLGMYYSSFPLYVGEISHPRIRGALVALIMQGLMLGNLCGTIMGKYLDMWLFASISLIPNLIFLGSFSLMPQTPHYLVRSNKMEEAAKSIRFYNRNADVTNELDALKQFMETNKALTLRDTWQALNTPLNRKTLLMVNIIFAFVQLSGLYTISAYMEIMLTKANVNIIKPSTLVISVSIISIASSWIATYTNDKCGRKIMLLLSSIGVASGMFLWGLNYQLLDLGYENPNLQWMSIIAAIVYQFSLAIGLMPVPTTFISEMFAPSVKGIGACISSGISGVFAFAASRSYQPMVDVLTEKYVFWIYGLLMITTGIYTMIFIPETKGKSLAEIQEILSQGIKSKSNNHSNKSKVYEENFKITDKV